MGSSCPRERPPTAKRTSEVEEGELFRRKLWTDSTYLGERHAGLFGERSPLPPFLLRGGWLVRPGVCSWPRPRTCASFARPAARGQPCGGAAEMRTAQEIVVERSGSTACPRREASRVPREAGGWLGQPRWGGPRTPLSASLARGCESTDRTERLNGAAGSLPRRDKHTRPHELETAWRQLQLAADTGGGRNGQKAVKRRDSIYRGPEREWSYTQLRRHVRARRKTPERVVTGTRLGRMKTQERNDRRQPARVDGKRTPRRSKSLKLMHPRC